MVGSSMIDSRCQLSAGATGPQMEPAVVSGIPAGSWPGGVRAKALGGSPGLVLLKRNSTRHPLKAARWILFGLLQ